MTTKTDIWNLALALLGQASLNQDDDNDRARKCKLFYPVVKEAALRVHNWTFARITAPLAELDARVQTAAAAYVYAYPQDALKILSVRPEFALPPVQYEGKKNGLPWKILARAEGRIILCGAKKAWAEYISRSVDESNFDPCFTQYLAWKLACALCNTLTGDERLLAQCERGAAQALDEAQYANMNDEEHFARPECSYLK